MFAKYNTGTGWYAVIYLFKSRLSWLCCIYKECYADFIQLPWFTRACLSLIFRSECATAVVLFIEVKYHHHHLTWLRHSCTHAASDILRHRWRIWSLICIAMPAAATVAVAAASVAAYCSIVQWHHLLSASRTWWLYKLGLNGCIWELVRGLTRTRNGWREMVTWIRSKNSRC